MNSWPSSPCTGHWAAAGRMAAKPPDLTSVFMTVKGQAEKISSMAQNQFFGELAVIGDGIRTATVRAEEDTSLLVLRRLDFERFKREYPILFYAMGVIAEGRIISG